MTATPVIIFDHVDRTVLMTGRDPGAEEKLAEILEESRKLLTTGGSIEPKQ